MSTDGTRELGGCYAAAVTSHNVSFDGRAEDFDRRSAPPDGAAADIARAVDDAARETGACAVLDVGAGTGALGAPLARRCAERGAAYLGLDLSLGMLAVFRSRWVGQSGTLIRADAACAWPLADASVGAVFAARAAHLFDFDTFLGEVRRVLTPSGALILGAVRRHRDAPRAVLRRQLHELLAAHGVEPRSARRRHGEMVDSLERDNAWRTSAGRCAASWVVRESLEEALAAWHRPGHLAGRNIPAPCRHEVLEELRSWALDRWGTRRYDAGHTCEKTAGQIPNHSVELTTTERFELTIVRP